MIDILELSIIHSTQSVITIEGKSKSWPCKIIHGLIVTPLFDKPSIKLPQGVMQESIPNAEDQVPFREDVANTVGFQHLAYRLRTKTSDWTIFLLIGRDCIEAQ